MTAIVPSDDTPDSSSPSAPRPAADASTPTSTSQIPTTPTAASTTVASPAGGSRTQPDRTQPDRTQPDRTQPDRTQPDRTQPDSGQPDTGRSDTPEVAWRPVLLIALAVGVILGVASAWYGPFGDEMYFVSAGHRPALGYADQPPMVPLLAAALNAIAPHSLVLLRLPSTLITAATVVVTALLTGELGGGRRAQVVASAASALGLYVLLTGHILATSTVDPFCWAVITWLVIRWIRIDRGDPSGRRHDWLLFGAGLVTAVALFAKILVPVLLGGLLLGVVVCGPRRMLRRPLLWAGMVLAVASTLPLWWWQAHHGWPQLQMRDVVRGESGLFGSRWQFVPRALYFAGLVPGAVLCLIGVWALMRLEVLRPWRAVGVAVLSGTAVLILAGGRPYYDTGFYAVLFAAASVALQQRTTRAPVWWRWTVSPTCFVLSAVVTALFVLPIGPASWRTSYDFGVMGQVGWPELTDSVARAYDALPPEQRAHTAVVAYSYWYASALEWYGPERGLPPTIHSSHRGFGYFDPPPDTATTALLVGRVPWARRFCSRLVPLPPHVGPRDGVNDHVTLSLCTPSRPWSLAWPTLRNLA